MHLQTFSPSKYMHTIWALRHFELLILCLIFLLLHQVRLEFLTNLKGNLVEGL